MIRQALAGRVTLAGESNVGFLSRFSRWPLAWCSRVAQPRGRVTSPRLTRSFGWTGSFSCAIIRALTVVETPMARAGKDADGKFHAPVRFITGANEAKQKIAMTTPVFMSGSDTNATMAFVLPGEVEGGRSAQAVGWLGDGARAGGGTIRRCCVTAAGAMRRSRRRRWPG